MGGPSVPSAQPESQVLQAYTQNLPGILQATAGQTPNTALQQLAATQATTPGYNALNLNQAQQYSLPLAQVGQQVQQSNALAGANTNLAQLQGPGAQVAQAALGVNQASNPNYYSVQNPASAQAANLLGAVNLNGLSPGEANAVERSNNQSLASTGNLGLTNPTNTISNALNFGGAFNSKLGLLGNALGAANQTAQSAQNSGFNPVSLALGQPNPAAASNFGTGTFTGTTPSTQNAATSGTLGFGSSALGSMNSANNALIGANAQLASAYTPTAYMNAAGSLMPNMSCCFIFMESYHGQLPWVVRKCRDRYYSRFPSVARGYKRMARWLVPVMQASPIVRDAVWRWMVRPLTEHGNHVYARPGAKRHNALRRTWFTLWSIYGKA